MWFVWILYIMCLVVTVFASNKLAEYVDALDKKTKISGAFLGGILLAGVTSLPELITSITSAIMKQPEMTLGNILGSNVFNLLIIAVLMLVFMKRCRNKNVSKSNVVITIFTLFISIMIFLSAAFNVKAVIPYLNINILTPIIIVLYFIAIWFSQKTEEKGNPDDIIDKKSTEEGVVNKEESLSVRKIVIRFIIYALILVLISVGMTYLVDKIAVTYNLGRGLVGALFLGIATSLPEIITSFTLVRLGNFDSAFGNIAGSCLFNFGVIALADVVFTSGTVFMTDLQSLILAICLVFSCLVLLAFALLRRSNLKIKNSLTVQTVCASLITLSYIVFLVLSTVLI